MKSRQDFQNKMKGRFVFKSNHNKDLQDIIQPRSAVVCNPPSQARNLWIEMVKMFVSFLSCLLCFVTN